MDQCMDRVNSCHLIKVDRGALRPDCSGVSGSEHLFSGVGQDSSDRRNYP